MDSIKIFVEEGRKKTFAGVIDWPGWCRWGRDGTSALDALVDYGPRYAQVFEGTGVEFQRYSQTEYPSLVGITCLEKSLIFTQKSVR
jgi:hypothetical protein